MDSLLTLCPLFSPLIAYNTKGTRHLCTMITMMMMMTKKKRKEEKRQSKEKSSERYRWGSSRTASTRSTWCPSSCLLVYFFFFLLSLHFLQPWVLLPFPLLLVLKTVHSGDITSSWIHSLVKDKERPLHSYLSCFESGKSTRDCVKTAMKSLGEQRRSRRRKLLIKNRT